MNQCQLLSTKATAVSYSSETHRWSITTETNSSHTTSLLFFCTGAKQKTLQLPIPTIPLEHALHLPTLQSILKPNEKVLLFGSQHSGCLVLSNLQNTGCSTTCVYKGEKPFCFARDGEYDGIKEQAATIADTILSGAYSRLEFVQLKDLSALSSAIRKADWVIYSIGFEPAISFLEESYDPKTGKFPGSPNAWGFGIAFPSSAPDSIHYDVSILAFTEHILAQRSEILESYRSRKLHDTN
jgi:thioredoxin reductase